MLKTLRSLWNIRRLGSRSYKARSRAVEALANLNDPRAAEPLRRLLREERIVNIQDGIIAALVRLGDVESLIGVIEETACGRKEIAEALGKLGDRRAVEPLIRLLASSQYARLEIAGALGQLGDRRAVEPLVRALGDSDFEVRSGVARALVRLGDPRAVEPLIQALGSVDWSARSLVAESLPKLGGTSALAPLVEALGHKSGDVRASVARALGELGDPRAVDPLIQVLGDGSGEVRMYAAFALSKLGERRLGAAVSGPYEDLGGLGKCGDPRAVDPLIRALGSAKSKHETVDLRKSAALGLGTLGDPRAVAPLVRALGDWYGSVRLEAAKALHKLGEPLWQRVIQGDDDDCARLAGCGDPRAFEPLIAALDEGLTGAGEALAKLRDFRAVEPLIQALGRGYSEAAKALAELGDLRAVEPLIRALDNDCSGAAEALAALGDPRAFEPLLGELQGNPLFPSRRRAAAHALGRSGDPRAIEPLSEALHDEDTYVRDAAARALLQMPDRRPALEPLIRALGRLSQEARTDVADALVGLGDVRAVEPLIKALGYGEEHARGTVAEALAKLGQPQWQQLVTGSNEDWLRLAKHEDPRALEALIEALGWPYYKIRQAAARALVAVALDRRAEIAQRWNEIKALVSEPHVDRDSCGSHGDRGVGLVFPDLPPGLDF
jgi:HEAT repeat protein